MHKDLSDDWRSVVEAIARNDAQVAYETGESLALARECWINAFDKAAAELG
jgi:hypothetical protein